MNDLDRALMLKRLKRIWHLAHYSCNPRKWAEDARAKNLGELQLILVDMAARAGCSDAEKQELFFFMEANP